MRKLLVGLTLVLLTGFAVTALVWGEAKGRKNRLFVAECSPPKKDALETITLKVFEPDGVSINSYHISVPLCKGCSSIDKAEAIRCALNEHEPLQGKVKAGTNDFNPAILQLIGQNGHTIKAGGGDNKSRQSIITFQGVGSSSTSPTADPFWSPDNFITLVFGPRMSGLDPEGMPAQFRFGVLGIKPSEEYCFNTIVYQNSMYLVDDVERTLKGANIGKVFREDPYTLFIYLYHGDGVLVGCDDDLLDLNWEFSEWADSDERKWEK